MASTFVVVAETTNVTIVEHWEEGELVSTEYPVLTFDFSGSMLPGKAIMHAVEGTHASGTVDASTSSLVEVQFEHHGLHLLELTTDYEGSTAGESKQKLTQSKWWFALRSVSSGWNRRPATPCPWPLDTRHEVGREPASALVIESTVSNPALITNIGGGQEVDITWGLIDDTQQACQSHQGTVGDGDAVTWKTVHFNTVRGARASCHVRRRSRFGGCGTDGLHPIRTSRDKTQRLSSAAPVVANGSGDEDHLVHLCGVLEQFDGFSEIHGLPNSVQDINTGMAVVRQLWL